MLENHYLNNNSNDNDNEIKVCRLLVTLPILIDSFKIKCES